MAETVEPTEASAQLEDAFEERGAQIACSRRTGISQGYLSQLARAERSAGPKVRRLLEKDDLAIPRVAWETPPKKRPKRKRADGAAA